MKDTRYFRIVLPNGSTLPAYGHKHARAVARYAVATYNMRKGIAYCPSDGTTIEAHFTKTGKLCTRYLVRGR